MSNKSNNYSDSNLNEYDIRNFLKKYEERKAFQRDKVKIEVGDLPNILDGSSFYDPYKKGVSFKSPDGKSKVFSKDCII